MNQYMRPGQALLPKQGQQFQNQRFPQLQRGGGMVGGRGRPVGSYKQVIMIMMVLMMMMILVVLN